MINKLVRVIRRVLFAPILICSRSSSPLQLVPSLGSSTYCVKNVRTAKLTPVRLTAIALLVVHIAAPNSAFFFFFYFLLGRRELSRHCSLTRY
jgi:hypothetical protein